jgi:hypothetical protein
VDVAGIYIPIGDELNRYSLSVKGLPKGRYEVTANERSLGKWKESDFERGINIASSSADPWQPGGSWDAQGHAVKVFTDMRDELVHARRGIERDLAGHPQYAALQEKAKSIEESLIELQRATAKPVPVQFRVRKLVEEVAEIKPKEFTYGEIDGEKLGSRCLSPKRDGHGQ